MDSLRSILSNKNFDEPPEVGIIKDFAKSNFQETVGVTVKDHEIIVSGRSANLMASLRLRGPEIARACQTDKKLIFRIG